MSKQTAIISQYKDDRSVSVMDKSPVLYEV